MNIRNQFGQAKYQQGYRAGCKVKQEALTEAFDNGYAKGLAVERRKWRIYLEAKLAQMPRKYFAHAQLINNRMWGSEVNPYIAECKRIEREVFGVK